MKRPMRFVLFPSNFSGKPHCVTFDPAEKVFTEDLPSEGDFMEADLEHLRGLKIEQSATIWDQASDITYYATRIM